MSKFDPEQFVANPDSGVFEKLKKDDLIVLGKHLGIDVRTSMKVEELRSVVSQHLVKEGVLKEPVFLTPASSGDGPDLSEKYKYELELKKLEYEREEKEREREREREREQREREFELRRLELEHEMELKKLELAGGSAGHPGTSHSSAQFDITKHIRLVPPFQEQDVDKYFLHFKKVAQNLKWPKEHWALLVQCVLTGKAQEIYTQLSLEQASSYDTVKEVILKGYELVPEAYRQKFRNSEKQSGQTFVEFARRKEQLFDRWCDSEKVEKDHDKLRQLFLVEEFKRCIHGDIRTFINEQQAKTLNDAARLADDFSLTHKMSQVNKQNFQFSTRNQNISPDNKQLFGSNRFASKEKYFKSNFDNRKNSEQNFESKRTTKSEQQQQSPKNRIFNPRICNYCKKEGHLVSDCWKLKKKEQGQESVKPTGFISSRRSKLNTHVRDDTFSDVKHVNKIMPESNANSDSVMEIFEPFIHDGFVSLKSDLSDATPIKILRDTGSSQSILLTDTLPFSNDSYSGSNVLIKGVDSVDYSSIPLHNVYLTSKLVSGLVKVGIQPSLPFKGVNLLLGNDLAGDKVATDPILSDKPCLNHTPDPIEEEIPDLYPSCVVTRAMAKTIRDSDKNDADDINLADSCLAQVFENEKAAVSSESDLFTNTNISQSISKSNLVSEQHKDPEISILFEKAVDKSALAKNSVCYFVQNDILMRKWRPPDVSADDDWAFKYQIVIPKAYRHEILSLAHETPLAGHLGTRKTLYKISQHFYWPTLRKDVAEFCRSCHTCQVVGKPNQTIPKAPLHPIPAFEEPFSRVIIDCVGPLPKTKSGCQYLLTIMCASTRFPEAIPLRNIKTKTIVDALIKFFSLFGLPKSIQSDQGSNFMSGLFQQIMHELKIRQFSSSAYHPESQGALERFHQTLKTMIKTYCFDTEKSWDKGIHLLLFAAREAVQESLGFSPFELVFGHSVRGPLKLFKEKFLSDSNDCLNLFQYVSDFRTRLSKACDLAKANLKAKQISMKTKFDKNAVSRCFQPGDKVLVLLPVPGNPLQARYFGPYIVSERKSEQNYIINTPDRRKSTQLCHINMLKPYFERKKDLNSHQSVNAISVCLSQDSCKTSEPNLLPDMKKLSNSDVLKNLDEKLQHLKPSEREDLKKLIGEYNHLFPDVPSRTEMIYHDVEIEDNATPIKQHPYRLNPLKQKYLKKEIDYLLVNDFIEPSKSNWSSPCILVPKPDGSYRMCTDYRKVNNVTKSDSFPIPRMEDCIDRIGNAKYVTKFDLLKGFWQVPLTERAKEISAFVTPNGLYQYKVMPFGMKNSPATFQRLINNIIADLDGCEAYIDDLIIATETWEDHVKIIRELFERLSKARLTVNLLKSEFGCATVTYLGHEVGQGHVKPVQAKITAILEFPRPTSKKQLMRFLGMVGYYRKFCPNFSKVAEPLTSLLKKNIQFAWSEECEIAFEKVRAMLVSAPVLSAPSFDLPFKLAVDASDVAVGGVLLQEDSSGLDHPVCYFSRKLDKSQRNYSTIEKECLALILALQHFEIYVTASNSPITVFTDHNPLVFLHKLKDKNQRLVRWSLFLQEYNLDIKHISGKDNLIADCLSRN